MSWYGIDPEDTAEALDNAAHWDAATLMREMAKEISDLQSQLAQAKQAPADDKWATIHRLVSWLDQQNGRTQEETGLRLLKLTEETGEVAQAWIGYTGQNPRKGTTHTLDQVAEELVDVIVTAAVALTSITDKPDRFLDAKLKKIAERVNA